MAKDRPIILNGDVEWDLAEWYLNECELTLSDFFGNERALTKEVWEAKQENIQFILKKNHFRREAYLIYAYFTLITGAELPSHLRAPIIEAARWENEKYRWKYEDMNQLRKFYLDDLREKVINYRPGKPVHLIFLKYNIENLTEGVVGLDNFWEEVKSGKIHERKHLNLDTCDLDALPAPILELERLETLSLEYNNLRSLPQKLSTLSNLEDLYLKGNKFTEFPEKLGNLATLEYIDLSENAITQLSSEICECKKLTKLVLNHNPLQKLPHCLRNHPNLTSIYLRHTRMTETPHSFKKARINIVCKFPE